jgi:hypothetical protein
MAMTKRRLGLIAAVLVLTVATVASAVNTKAQIFVPHAISECAQIRAQIAALQAHAVELKSRYDALGGASMDGLSTYDFTTYGLTLTEFTDGMTDLSTAHNAVALSNILSAGAYNKVVKIGEGQ